MNSAVGMSRTPLFLEARMSPPPPPSRALTLNQHVRECLHVSASITTTTAATSPGASPASHHALTTLPAALFQLLSTAPLPPLKILHNNRSIFSSSSLTAPTSLRLIERLGPVGRRPRQAGRDSSWGEAAVFQRLLVEGLTTDNDGGLNAGEDGLHGRREEGRDPPAAAVLQNRDSSTFRLHPGACRMLIHILIPLLRRGEGGGGELSRYSRAAGAGARRAATTDLLGRAAAADGEDVSPPSLLRYRLVSPPHSQVRSHLPVIFEYLWSLTLYGSSAGGGSVAASAFPLHTWLPLFHLHVLGSPSESGNAHEATAAGLMPGPPCREWVPVLLSLPMYQSDPAALASLLRRWWQEEEEATERVTDHQQQQWYHPVSERVGDVLWDPLGCFHSLRESENLRHAVKETLLQQQRQQESVVPPPLCFPVSPVTSLEEWRDCLKRLQVVSALPIAAAEEGERQCSYPPPASSSSHLETVLYFDVLPALEAGVRISHHRRGGNEGSTDMVPPSNAEEDGDDTRWACVMALRRYLPQLLNPAAPTSTDNTAAVLPASAALPALRLGLHGVVCLMEWAIAQLSSLQKKKGKTNNGDTEPPSPPSGAEGHDRALLAVSPRVHAVKHILSLCRAAIQQESSSGSSSSTSCYWPRELLLSSPSLAARLGESWTESCRLVRAVMMEKNHAVQEALVESGDGSSGGGGGSAALQAVLTAGAGRAHGRHQDRLHQQTKRPDDDVTQILRNSAFRLLEPALLRVAEAEDEWEGDGSINDRTATGTHHRHHHPQLGLSSPLSAVEAVEQSQIMLRRIILGDATTTTAAAAFTCYRTAAALMASPLVSCLDGLVEGVRLCYLLSCTPLGMGSDESPGATAASSVPHFPPQVVSSAMLAAVSLHHRVAQLQQEQGQGLTGGGAGAAPHLRRAAHACVVMALQIWLRQQQQSRRDEGSLRSSFSTIVLPSGVRSLLQLLQQPIRGGLEGCSRSDDDDGDDCLPPYVQSLLFVFVPNSVSTRSSISRSEEVVTTMESPEHDDDDTAVAEPRRTANREAPYEEDGDDLAAFLSADSNADYLWIGSLVALEAAARLCANVDGTRAVRLLIPWSALAEMCLPQRCYDESGAAGERAARVVRALRQLFSLSHRRSGGPRVRVVRFEEEAVGATGGGGGDATGGALSVSLLGRGMMRWENGVVNPDAPALLQQLHQEQRRSSTRRDNSTVWWAELVDHHQQQRRRLWAVGPCPTSECRRWLLSEERKP